MATPLHVLFVEDSDDDTQLMIRELRRGGYNIEWRRIETGAAMQAALASQPWDLVISDHSMPQFSSTQALEVLKDSGQDLPFIIVSGSIGEDAAVSALKAGAHDFLVKGNWARLIPAIQRELRDTAFRRERKKALGALRAAEARLSGILDLAADGVIVIDGQQHVILFNQSAEHIFGYKADEVLGQPLDTLLPPRFVKIHQEHVNTFRIAPESARRMGERLEIFGRRKDGGEFPAEASISRLEQGGEITFTVILRDVTERKQTEVKIQQQLERLTALREIDQAIASTHDVRMSLNILVSHAKSLLNMDAASVLLLNPVQSKLEYGAGIGFRTRVAKTTSVKLRESYAGRAAREQRLVQIPNLAEDTDNYLRTHFLKGEDFVSYYGMPLIVKGKAIGVLEVFNRSFTVRDQDWLDFFSILAGQAAIAIDNAQLFENLERSKNELEHRVAERTEVLNRTNIELEHANRAKDEFLANMSHELRTPLNAILGLTESLLEQRRDPLSDYQKNSLQIIESSGRHLLELINDVLDLSKIEAGIYDLYPQIVDVDMLCRSSLAFVKEQALRKFIDLHYEPDKAFSKIWADPRRLKQILVNLLVNAVKFSPEHGKVTLQVHSETEQDLLRFSVIDNGIGIAKEDLTQLFKPFVQVDNRLNRKYGGTGLGLALVHKLTDLHGGSVQVDSEVGAGSRFTINIPWGQYNVSEQENIETEGDRLTRKGLVKSDTSSEESLGVGIVLLAEDNAANLLTIGEYLKSYGYTMVNAHDGVEAIKRAGETNPDIILMDIQMPAMDGLEATRRLRQDPRFKSKPIIALTALAMPGDRERCLAAGADEYMSKPVSLKKLLHTIKEMLDKTK